LDENTVFLIHTDPGHSTCSRVYLFEYMTNYLFHSTFLRKGIDGKIILEWILGKVWTGSIWLGTGTSGGLLWTW